MTKQRYLNPFRRVSEYPLREDLIPSRVHGFRVSYNPDDNHFYIHDNDQEQTTLARRAARRDNWRNVVDTCKRLAEEREVQS